jgi:DNA-binding CsgD family transcriptional regulator
MRAGPRNAPVSVTVRRSSEEAYTRKVVFSTACYHRDMGADTKLRAAERIRQLAGRGLDVAAFWRECGEVLATAVPHHLAPCWFTFDPASLLITSHFDPVITEIDGDFLAHEYNNDDVMKMANVARSPNGATSIHEETDGDPSRSPGWRQFVQPYGGDQQLLVALRSKPDTVWGMLALYRNPAQPPFEHDDVDFLTSVARNFARGARHGLLLGEAADPDWPLAPSLIILNEDRTVQSMTPGAELVLADMPGGEEWLSRGTLPTCLLAVASRALSSFETPDAAVEGATARVRAQNGQWMTLHGTPLLREGERRVAVIIERTDPDRLMPLLMDAYGLTDREKGLTRLVLQGEATSEIAAKLFISPHTVQQHLKSVFEKTGVRSRRELVSKVFFAHYEPRIRDNERRTEAGHPLRGGPVPLPTRG